MPQVSFNLSVPVTFSVIGGASGFYVGHILRSETHGAMISFPARFFGTIGGACIGFTIGSATVAGWNRSAQWRSKWQQK